MKRVKLNMTRKIVYVQTFDLLEYSTWNLSAFQFQFNWSLRSSKGNFLNNVEKSILNVTEEMTDLWKEQHSKPF